MDMLGILDCVFVKVKEAELVSLKKFITVRVKVSINDQEEEDNMEELEKRGKGKNCKK